VHSADLGDDLEVEGPDLSPSKTQIPDLDGKIKKLNDGGKHTVGAVRRSTRARNSRNSSIALEIDLDELDIDEQEKS
jgi:hypothetical protein